MGKIFHGVILWGVLILVFLLHPMTARSLSVEELAEMYCEYNDGVDCNFSLYHGSYTFGSHHVTQGGSGKIRSDGAYCLIRDGNGQIADATFGEDWYEFGTKSYLHLTHAGQDDTGGHRANGQRVVDLVVFGVPLRGAEVQDFYSTFPTEKQKGKSGLCKKWLKLGNTKMCTEWRPGVPSMRTGYYFDLDTHEYNWKVDIDAIAKEYFDVEVAGLEFALEQNVPFDYSGTTLLDEAAFDLNDGVIPLTANTRNAWQWGTEAEYDPATSSLNLEIPVYSQSVASLRLFFGLTLHGYYALEEAPFDPNGEPSVLGDPDYGQGGVMVTGNENQATMTHLEGGTGVEIIAKVCLDFGWFGTWCGDFVLVDAENMEERTPMNQIVYTPRGMPIYAEWSGGSTVDEAADINSQIETCLSAETISADPIEPASPADWVNFAGAVADEAAEHLTPCFVVAPNNTVEYTAPSFKLCDDEGRVYEATDGINEQN